MSKKIVIFGGGTGLSYLLQGLKNQDLEMSVVVTIADNGGSTGKIRNYYDIPAPGDLRRVVVALSEEKGVEQLMNYRFDENLEGHTVGNLMLTALVDLKGNMQEAVKMYAKLLGVEQEILPISNQSLTLCAEVTSGKIIYGESQISKYPEPISKIFYENNPQSNPEVVKKINEADAIIFSSGSLYTSIIPNLVFEQIKLAIDQSSAKKIYVANLMTERGETEKYKLSHHVNAINEHLEHSKIDYVIANNNFIIDEQIKNRYQNESSHLVEIDYSKLACQIIEKNLLICQENGYIRHNHQQVAQEIRKIVDGDNDE